VNALNSYARMAKSADAADLKSAGPKGLWEFKSPSGHETSPVNIGLLAPITAQSRPPNSHDKFAGDTYGDTLVQ
jgi:hypothetical protein